MKAYGKGRRQTAYRKKRGTSRPCPCCKTGAERHGKACKDARDNKKRERRQGREEMDMTKKSEQPTENFLSNWSRVIGESMENSRKKKQEWISSLTLDDLVVLAQEQLEGVIEQLSFRGYKLPPHITRDNIEDALFEAAKRIKAKGG